MITKVSFLFKNETKMFVFIFSESAPQTDVILSNQAKSLIKQGLKAQPELPDSGRYGQLPLTKKIPENLFFNNYFLINF